VDGLHPVTGEIIEPVAGAKSENLVGLHVGGCGRVLYLPISGTEMWLQDIL
jgi:hypothetical protein